MDLGFTLLRNACKLFVCIFVCVYNCTCPPVHLLSMPVSKKFTKVVPPVQNCAEQNLYLQKQAALLYYPRLLWSSVFCALSVKELVRHSCTLGKVANASSLSRDVLRGRREAEPQRGEMRGSGGSLKTMSHLWWMAETPLEQLIQLKQHAGF